MAGKLKRAFNKFRADEMIDRAAALTYYMMMSLFPALLVGVSLLGLLGNRSLVTKTVDYAGENGAPTEVTDALEALLTRTVEGAGGALSLALVFGIGVALYGASAAFGAAGRALNDVYDVEESRGFVMHKLADIGFTILVILLSIVALVSVFLGGGVAGDLFGTIGLGETAAAIWRVARWAVAIGAVLALYSIVFAFAPDIDARRRRIVSPGGFVAVAIWMLASAAFFFYVANFGRYGATYGAFAGAVILLLWLYLSNIAFLFGAELNSVIDGQARRSSRTRGPYRTLSAGSTEDRADRSGDGYGRDVLAPPEGSATRT